MKREEWQELWTSYYALLAIATRVGCYSDELKRMERPLWECRPNQRKDD